ncbi:MAG: type II secretion system protein GspM [bacterium]
MTDKEDALRKKAKQNLDPKGWEALLEGAPRVDEQETLDLSETAPQKDPAPEEKHIFKVTDESGDVSEQVTSRERIPDQAAKAPHSIEAMPGNPEETSPDGSDSMQEPIPPDAGPSALQGPEVREKISIYGRILDRVRKQPPIQRFLLYYQGLSTREQRVLLLGCIFLSVLALYTLVISPMFQKNELINIKIQKKKAELSEMNRLQSSVVQDRGGMERIKKIIEQRGQGFSVFSYLEQLATKAEVKDKILYIRPQRETPVGQFLESLAEIKLNNINLEELTRFLYQIESSEDLLYIKNLKMTTGKDQNALEATLSVGTLVQGGESRK